MTDGPLKHSPPQVNMAAVAPEGRPVKRLLVPALALLVVLPLAVAQQPAAQVNRNARFGLPGPASTDREAYLIDRPQYALSYNATTRTVLPGPLSAKRCRASRSRPSA